MNPPLHDLAQPSPWVVRWTHLIQEQGAVLDVACGSGRHLAWLQQQGFQVTGVDRDTRTAQQTTPTARLVEADIEQGPWPLVQNGQLQRFDALVVTNYLWRPLMATLLDSLAPGGVLLYETFASGNETVGRPARPDFLLQDGELLQICTGMRVVAYECGFLNAPERFVQRIAAIKAPVFKGDGAPPLRHAL